MNVDQEVIDTYLRDLNRQYEKIETAKTEIFKIIDELKELGYQPSDPQFWKKPYLIGGHRP